jgi:hypothetical protein
MALQTLYNNKEKAIDKAVTAFVRGAKKSENEISDAVFRLVRRYNNKDLSIVEKAQVVNEIEAKVLELLRKSTYKGHAQKFIESLGVVKDYQKKIMQSATGIKGGKVKFKEIERFAKIQLSDNLFGKGVESNVVEPLKQRIAQNLLAGVDNVQLESIISDFFKTDETLGRLTRYTSVIANDTLWNYGGMINNEYRKEYGLTNFMYVGSLIDDSRGQCRHWVAMGTLTTDQLEQEIPIAIDGGFLGGFRCSGMKDWTNIDNFTIERGGWNCRHEAIPVA